MPNWFSRLQKFFTPRRRWVSLVIALVIVVGILGVGHFAWGAPKAIEWIFQMLFVITVSLVSLIGKLLVAIISILIAVCKYNGFINASAVSVGWVVCRDICNLFFVLILLYNAFSLVLGGLGYAAKTDPMKNVIKIIIAAIVINFSKLICGLLIDVAQVFMMIFVSAFKDSLAGNFANALGLQNMLQNSNVTATGAEGDTGFGPIFLAAVLAGVALIIATIVVAIMTIILLGRILILWFLIILSPFAWLASIAPVPQVQSFNGTWWKKFTSQVIVGPLMAFFLWLSLTIMANNAKLSETLNDSSGKKVEISKVEDSYTTTDAQKELKNPNKLTAAISAFGEWDNLLSFGIAIALLVLSLTQAQQMGVMGGKIAGDWAKKIQDKPQEWAKGFYGRRIDVGGRLKEAAGSVAEGLRKTDTGKSLAKSKLFGSVYQSWTGQLSAAKEQSKVKRFKAVTAGAKHTRFGKETKAFEKKLEDVAGMNELDQYMYGQDFVKRGEFKKINKDRAGDNEKALILLRATKKAKESELGGAAESKAAWKAMLAAANKDVVRLMITPEYLNDPELVKDQDDIADIYERAVAVHVDDEITPEAMDIIQPAIRKAVKIGSSPEETTAKNFNNLQAKQSMAMLTGKYIDDNGIEHNNEIKDENGNVLTGIDRMKATNREEERDKDGKVVLDEQGQVKRKGDTLWRDEETVALGKSLMAKKEFDQFKDEDKKEFYEALSRLRDKGTITQEEMLSTIQKLESKDKLAFVGGNSFQKLLNGDKKAKIAAVDLVSSLKRDGSLGEISDNVRLNEVLETAAKLEKDKDISTGSLGSIIDGFSSSQKAEMKLKDIIKDFDMGDRSQANSISSISRSLAASKDGIANVDTSTINELAIKGVKGKSSNPNWQDDLMKLMAGKLEAFGNLSNTSDPLRMALLDAGLSIDNIDNLVLNSWKQADKKNMQAESVNMPQMANASGETLAQHIERKVEKMSQTTVDRMSSPLLEALSDAGVKWAKEATGRTPMQDINMTRQNETAELRTATKEKYEAVKETEEYKNNPEAYPENYMETEEYKNNPDKYFDEKTLIYNQRTIETKKRSITREEHREDINKVTVRTKEGQAPEIAMNFDSEAGRKLNLGAGQAGANFSGLALNDENRGVIKAALEEQGIDPQEIARIMAAESISLYNKGREGTDIRYLRAHENLHGVMDKIDPQVLKDIWEAMPQANRDQYTAQAKLDWGDPNMSENDVMQEVFADGFANTTRWAREGGIQLDEETIKALREAGVESSFVKNLSPEMAEEQTQPESVKNTDAFNQAYRDYDQQAGNKQGYLDFLHFLKSEKQQETNNYFGLSNKEAAEEYSRHYDEKVASKQAEVWENNMAGRSEQGEFIQQPATTPESPAASVSSPENMATIRSLDNLGLKIDSLKETLDTSGQNTNELRETIGSLRESIADNPQAQGQLGEDFTKVIEDLTNNLNDPEKREEYSDLLIEKFNDALGQSQDKTKEIVDEFSKSTEFNRKAITDKLQASTLDKNYFERLLNGLDQTFNESKLLQKSQIKLKQRQRVQDLRTKLRDDTQREAFNTGVLEMLGNLGEAKQPTEENK